MTCARESVWTVPVGIVAMLDVYVPTALGQQWVTPGVSAPRVQQVIFNSAAVGSL